MLLLAFFAAALSLPQAETRTTEFTLDNGMRFLVHVQPGTPVFLLHADAGASREAKGTSGLCQILKRLQMQNAAAFEKAGGKDVRSWASADRALTSVILPAEQAALWFQLESERLLKPDFGDMEKARSAALAERKRRAFDPTEVMLAAAFPTHPYGVPVVGRLPDLEGVKQADVAAFFARNYVASNLVGVIVGDVDPAQMKQLAGRWFGRLPRGNAPAPLDLRETPQDGERRKAVVSPDGSNGFIVGFRRGGLADPSYPVWDLLTEVVRARLQHTLRDEKKAVSRIDVLLPFPGVRYETLFAILALGGDRPVEEAVYTELERLRGEPVPPEELAPIKERFRRSLGTIDSVMLASELADWQSMTGDWRNLYRHFDWVEAVTAAAIQELARDTFRPGNRTVVTAAANESAGRN